MKAQLLDFENIALVLGAVVCSIVLVGGIYKIVTNGVEATVARKQQEREQRKLEHRLTHG